MLWLANDIKVVLRLGVVPAFIAVILLVVAVDEPENVTQSTTKKNFFTLADARHLPKLYWFIVVLGAVFTLSRFSEAFLILRAQYLGLAIGYVPLIMIVTNIVYALFAYPASAAADRLPARTFLVLGLVVLVAADAVLALAGSPWIAILGAGLWGLHMALTQGLLSKLVADTAPAELRGTAFGVFNLVSGVALLLASIIAGWMWSMFGPSATFIVEALFAALAAAGLLLYHSELHPVRE